MHKVLGSFAIAAVAAIAISGCSPNAGTDPSSGETVTLQYAIWDMNQEAAMQRIADTFSQENPDVDVQIQLIPYGDYFVKLQTSIAGGDAPDVFWMNGPNIALYASEGVLAPLGEQDVDTSMYPPGLVELYTHGGTLYGAPKDLDTIGLWYNKELFDAAGVDYPQDGWTWDDMRQAAEALTNPDEGVFGIAAAQLAQENYYNSICQAGGRVISPDGKVAGYDSPEALAGITFWTDFIAQGWSPTAEQMVETTARDLFLSGKVAMYQTGSWSAGAFADNPDVAKIIDVAPLPTGPRGNQSVIHGLANVASAHSENLDLAKQFAVFASGEQAATIQAADGAVIPAYRGSHQAWVDAAPHFNLQTFIAAIDTAMPYPASKNTSAWTKHEEHILTQVWAGKLDPETGLKQLDEKMQAELDRE